MSPSPAERSSLPTGPSEGDERCTGTGGGGGKVQLLHLIAWSSEREKEGWEPEGRQQWLKMDRS